MSTPVEIAPARASSASCWSASVPSAPPPSPASSPSAKGLAKPIGSLDSDGHIRLGKRTENRSPLISDFVPLAELDDIVFGGWDIFDDNCYEAASTPACSRSAARAGEGRTRSDQADVGGVRSQYVKRLDGPNVKKGKNKKDLAEQLIADIRKFKADNSCDRLVVIWAGSTEVFMTEAPCHQSLAAFEKGLVESDPAIASSMIYAYAAISEGLPYAQRRAEPERGNSRAAGTGREDRVAGVRQRHEDGPDADQDDHRAGAQGAPDRRQRLVLDQHPRQPRRRSARRSGVVQDQGREQEGRRSTTSSSRTSIRISTRTSRTSSASTTTRRAATTKRAGTTSTSSAGWTTRCS